LSEFESTLERIRNELKIPGFSAAITKNRKIVWAKGFGFANKENSVKALPETVYHLASLTKPFAAVVLMQLIEENIITLETKISDFGIDLGTQEVIRVKHLLSHTSEGVPGTSYNYSGDRFATLDEIILSTTGKSFCKILDERIIHPLKLSLTAPFPFSIMDCDHNTNVLEKMAQGYTSNGQEKEPYRAYFGTSAGLVSNVLDMSNFSIALDNDVLLSLESKELMYTPTISNSGEELPYGLGWFIDNNEDVKIIWHYGYWDAVSSLILKIPEKELSFVILANSDRLSSASTGIGSDEDVNCSVVAQEFLNAFVYGNAQLPDISIY
jgi:CubicO group peptidase (beta-lactamase class C family)